MHDHVCLPTLSAVHMLQQGQTRFVKHDLTCRLQLVLHCQAATCSSFCVHLPTVCEQQNARPSFTAAE